MLPDKDQYEFTVGPGSAFLSFRYFARYYAHRGQFGSSWTDSGFIGVDPIERNLTLYCFCCDGRIERWLSAETQMASTLRFQMTELDERTERYFEIMQVSLDHMTMTDFELIEGELRQTRERSYGRPLFKRKADSGPPKITFSGEWSWVERRNSFWFPASVDGKEVSCLVSAETVANNYEVSTGGSANLEDVVEAFKLNLEDIKMKAISNLTAGRGILREEAILDWEFIKSNNGNIEYERPRNFDLDEDGP